jgi:hypothetical protein
MNECNISVCGPWACKPVQHDVKKSASALQAKCPEQFLYAIATQQVDP